MPISEGETSSRNHERIMETFLSEGKAALGSDWEGVIKLSESYPDPDALFAKETEFGHTAVNLAVLDGQDKVVEELVNLMKRNGVPHASRALGTENDSGNTPLHYAAAIGSVGMCKCIAEVDSGLITRRNHDGETPLFLAVLHGNKHAFRYLHSIIFRSEIEQKYTYCRRYDGDTILHCAINAEYLDLACEIVYSYPRLTNWVNQQGLSPLHILAAKPWAFRSGSQVQGFNKVIYLCIYEHQTFVGRTSSFEGPEYNESAKMFPENYQTCFNLAWLLKKVSCSFVFGSGKRKSNQNQDAEDPNFSLGSLETEEDGDAPCFDTMMLLRKTIMLIIICLGSSTEIMKMKEIKQKHVWSNKVLDVLLRNARYEHEDDGRRPQRKSVFFEEGTTPYSVKDGGDVTFSDALDSPPPPRRESIKETAILIAAKNGVVEMVDGILKCFPLAVHDKNCDDKNIVFLAVENRQEDVYRLFLKNNIMKEAVFRKVDKDGNTALHLAAKYQEHKPWLMPVPALEMQWEIKWYEFVRDTIPNHFNVQLQSNKQGKSAEEIFTDTHKDLVKSGGEWLTKLSESCSTAAGLTATVTFATSSSVPGGLGPDGRPILQNQPEFCIFAVASLLALCSSFTALAIFLTIRASGFRESDFRTNLPLKLLVALSSLSLSSISVSVSFCASNYIIIKQKLKYAVLPIYVVTVAVVIGVIFSTTWYSVYSHLIRARWRSNLYKSSTIKVTLQ